MNRLPSLAVSEVHGLIMELLVYTEAVGSTLFA